MFSGCLRGGMCCRRDGAWFSRTWEAGAPCGAGLGLFPVAALSVLLWAGRCGQCCQMGSKMPSLGSLSPYALLQGCAKGPAPSQGSQTLRDCPMEWDGDAGLVLREDALKSRRRTRSGFILVVPFSWALPVEFG